MGIKYFCDKCGKEIKESDFITIKIDMGIHKIEEKFYHFMDDKKTFMCEKCQEEFVVKFKKFKEIFNIV